MIQTKIMACPSPAIQQAILHIYQGDDYAATVSVFVEDASGTRTEADLAGYGAIAQIRRDVADVDTTVDVDIALTIELPNLIRMFIPHAVTATLTGSYVWDLQLTSPDDIVTTILHGSVMIRQEVSRMAAELTRRAVPASRWVPVVRKETAHAPLQRRTR